MGPHVQVKAFARSYNAMKAPATFLKEFMEKNDLTPMSLEKIVVASSFLEKILNSKIGGTVAQITTAGFEHWPRLRQDLQSPFLELSPQRTDALAMQDLLFPLRERIDAEGRIKTPLDKQNLDEIIQKLKSRQVQRVCVNLLFAGQNPVHQNMIVERLNQEGFEVFSIPPDEANRDEVSVWRKNVLNASLCGTFDEIKNSFLGSEDPLPVEFLTVDLRALSNSRKDLCTSIFAPVQLLISSASTYDLVAHLGLESWSILNPHVNQAEWDSPWGEVSGPIPCMKAFKVQPTQEFVFDSLEGLILSSSGVGFEPGPILLGRALKPTLFDLLMTLNKNAAPADWLRGESQKFEQTMQALLRTSKSFSMGSQTQFETLGDLYTYFMQHVCDQIGLQTLLQLHNDKKRRVQLTGFFAAQLYPLLEKKWPEISWVLDSEADQRIAMNAALCSFSPSQKAQA